MKLRTRNLMRELKSFSLLAALACLGGCGTLPSGGTASSAASSGIATQGGNVLSSVLGLLLGQSHSIKRQDLIGTWTYQSPECRFESENLLKKAGGEVAAAKVESKLAETFAKVGIKEGVSQYTFAEDGTFQMSLGSRALAGTYDFDESSRTLTLKGTFGLTSLKATVCRNGSDISLLFDADKLLSLASMAGSLTGSSTLQGLSSLIGSYDGMKVGFNLKK